LTLGDTGTGAARLKFDGLEQRAQLGVAVAGVLDRVGVDPERYVVQKRATVHIAKIDRPFKRRPEGVKRANQIIGRDADIPGEVVACTGGDLDKWVPADGRSRCHHCQRSITPRNPDSIGAAGHHSLAMPRLTASLAPLTLPAHQLLRPRRASARR
jgi:hypothetical protein